MAHLALLVDADPTRREPFAASVRRLFAELPGTTIGETASGPLACLWAAGPGAPVDLQLDGDRLSLLVGYAVDDAGRWATARDLAAAWLADDGEQTVHDGYHVAFAYDPTRGLAVGVDPLGMFPLYHATLPDGAWMAATTPQAFLAHPLFQWQVDRTGLAGILLAHGLLEDRPLLAGTKRLRMGHRLRAWPGRPPEERPFFEFTGTPPPAGETFAGARERIAAELLAAVRRHRAPGDDTVLMLSGGLDSRLLGGCLADLGIPTRAVTFGRPRDYEVRAATAVAARLGIPVERVSTEDADGDFVARIRRTARFGHLASGPSGDDFAEGLAIAATRARFNWSGIPFDWVFEPVSYCNGYDAATARWSFTGLLDHVNAWGVPITKLPALLGTDGHELCREVVGEMEASCTHGPLARERQSAVFRWNQRIRNDLGAAVHRTSFTAWPLLPATDRRILTALFGLPITTCADRAIEQAILVTRRPDLAAIPLDTNSFRFEPLAGAVPPPRGLGRVRRSLIRRLRRAAQPFLPATDPRRYERLFDVDQRRWRAVREAAEPLRPLLERHLDGGGLAAVLPPPGRRLRSRESLKAGSPIRLLCGLAFLLDQ